MSRLLYGSSSSNSSPPPPLAVDSDIVVILAALLCALICVIGLALVARCACLRRAVATTSSVTSSSSTASTSKGSSGGGLSKKALQSLPTHSYDPLISPHSSDCSICLTDFLPRDCIRILPQCSHAFHVGCVDPWLGAHSSCPSCRTLLVLSPPRPRPRPPLPPPIRCQKCGATASSLPHPDIPDTNNTFLP